MRVLVTWLLTLGLVVSPALAGTGPGDDKDSTTKTSDTSTAATKKTDASTTAKSEAAKAASSTLENELQQLRDLLEAQSRQIQAQSDQLREQQQKMMELETELKTETATRESFSSSAPDSRTAGLANASANPVGAANGSPSPDAAPGQAGAEGTKAIYFKGITLTPGGFLSADTIFRNKALGADISTPLNSIPFPGNSGSQTTEFNASGRASRISLLAEGKLPTVKLSGYVEADFLGTGITSTDNSTNSYALRLRQGWGQAKFDNGWSFTGGQMWTLATQNSKGIDNRVGAGAGEQIPQTIDTSYNAGFTYTRQYGFRVVKSFGDKFAVGASVEESATTLTVHGNPTITALSTVNANEGGVTTPTIATTVYNNFLVGSPGTSTGAYNPTGTYAYNKTPDFVVKAALDPGWGHYEVFGLVSNFRDRAFPCYYANGGYNFPTTLPGTDPDNPPTNIPATPCTIAGPANGSTNPTAGAFSDSRTGGGIGANARVPLLNKKVDLGFHILGGSGIGRYGSAGLPDATVRPDGTLALLRNYQALGTLELHPTPKLDIYMYAGGEYSSRASYSYTNQVTGKAGTAGYGSPAFRNDGCFVEPLPVATPGNPPNTTSVLGSTGFIPGSLANCAGDTRNVLEGTIGFWYRVYAGEKGRVQWGPQYSYVVRNTWYGAGASSGSVASPHGIDNMLFTSFRYYLP